MKFLWSEQSEHCVLFCCTSGLYHVHVCVSTLLYHVVCWPCLLTVYHGAMLGKVIVYVSCVVPLFPQVKPQVPETEVQQWEKTK